MKTRLITLLMMLFVTSVSVFGREYISTQYSYKQQGKNVTENIPMRSVINIGNNRFTLKSKDYNWNYKIVLDSKHKEILSNKLYSVTSYNCVDENYNVIGSVELCEHPNGSFKFIVVCIPNIVLGNMTYSYTNNIET